MLSACLGVAAVAGSLWLRSEDGAFAIALLLAGIAFLALALLLPWLQKAKLPGGFDLEFREREAAARAADAGVAVEEVARDIASEDDDPPSPSPQDEDVIGSLNYVAGNMALQAIFDWTTTEGEPLEGCQLRLYLLDEEDGRLRAVLAPPDAASATAWEVGQGATGTAYETGDYVIATGAAVSDGTHNLTPDQQERFRKLAAVAALPVRNAASRIIGVVTASTSVLDHRLDTEEGRRDHTLATLLVSRVLIELFQWFDDEP